MLSLNGLAVILWILVCELVSMSASENEVQSDDDSEDDVDQTPCISLIVMQFAC